MTQHTYPVHLTGIRLSDGSEGEDKGVNVEGEAAEWVGSLVTDDRMVCNSEDCS
jgi:hypothetical protein